MPEHWFGKENTVLDKCNDSDIICTNKMDVNKIDYNFHSYPLVKPSENINKLFDELQLKNPFQLLDSCPSGLETAVWYMGKHGLNWTRGFPVVDTGFSGYAGEAHTSICDHSGKLLFYTNNNEIYNSMHQIMDNGSINSPFGYAGASSTMNLVLLQPGSDSLYWIFYPGQITDYTDTFAKKLRYAVIDMSLNGGLGKVILKHQTMIDTSSERVEGIRHCNGKDWWIIGQNAITQEFTVWNLDQTGLSLNGKMNSGVVNNFDYRYALRGYLKSSHSGSIIAEVTHGDRSKPNPIEIHRFDPSTGTISGGVVLNLNLIGEFVNGAEFSPDDTKLYITGSKIWQVDLSDWDTAAINKSLVLISAQAGRNTGAPVLGPNGKIYITTFSSIHTFLYTIEKPNLKGLACDFRLFGFNLGAGSGLGAPHFAQGIQFPYRLYTRGPYEFCADTTVRYVLTDPCPHPDLVWQLPDGGIITRHNGDTIDVYFAKPGYKRVIAAYPTACGYKNDTLKIKVNNCNCTPNFTWLLRDSLICSGSEARFKFSSNAESVFINGNLLSADSFKINSLSNDTCLNLHIHFAEFCDSTASVCISTKKQKEVRYDSLWFCRGDTLVIAGNTYNSDTLLSIIQPGPSGCDSISYLQLLTYPVVNQTEHTKWICPGDSILVNFQWYKDSVQVQQNYSDKHGCDSMHTIYIKLHPVQQVNSFDHVMCKGDSVFFSGVWFTDSLHKQIQYQDQNGCDSIWQLNIQYYPQQIPDTTVYEICPGDSVLVQGKWRHDTILLESEYQNHFGCDSTHWSVIRLKHVPQQQNFEFYLCPGDSIFIANAWVNTEASWTSRKQNQGTCDSVFNYAVKWYEEVLVDVASEHQIEEGDSLTLDPYYSFNVSKVSWSPDKGIDCVNCPKPKVSPTGDTKYYVQVTDENGCMFTDSILIRVNKKTREPYIPNSFSPNGDNINDRWMPVMEHGRGTIEQMQVFDRWGNQVFECKNTKVSTQDCRSWDGTALGKKCQPGVYVYQIIWRDTKGVLYKKVGDVNLFL
ncbi:MAG: gliding motility-associated C-terminal domain-containing protein [Saprospiraceae bacterium]|nr:gliding motility-associated C-terminal domain-containing protein [Saprospiraceae bacterium]